MAEVAVWVVIVSRKFPETGKPTEKYTFSGTDPGATTRPTLLFLQRFQGETATTGAKYQGIIRQQALPKTKDISH